jgi:N5-(cytidine 5'-diphosphoramidyl)-L-glutamine hydrolase
MSSRRRRVGITQRQVDLPDRDERRDALDVRLPGLLWDLGLCPVPLANSIDDVPGYLAALGIDALLLSGGDDPGVTPQRDRFEDACLDVAEGARMPVLGICRGMQRMALRAGAQLVAVEGHRATRHAVTGPFSAGRADVNSFHAWAVPATVTDHGYRSTATAPDGTVEAMVHEQLPWVAIMWHPERDAPTAAADRELLATSLGPTSVHRDEEPS